MPAALLPDRAIIRIGGAEALPWLQNLVTCDIATLKPGEARYGGLLTPQGKILFDFIATLGRIGPGETEDALVLDTPAATAADFARRLAFYRLRAKVTVEHLGPDAAEPKLAVAASWGADRAYQGDALTYPDPRCPGLGDRMIGIESDLLAVAEADRLAYETHRIGLGIPEGGLDFAFGDAFPHEALFDQIGGVDFKKGCYVGQEVVSRMQHRGTARTRLVPVHFAGEIVPPGTEVRAGDRPVGTMGSSAAGRGLAMLRLDRVAEALSAGAEIRAGEVTLALVKPDWWNAPWPQGA